MDKTMEAKKFKEAITTFVNLVKTALKKVIIFKRYKEVKYCCICTYYKQVSMGHRQDQGCDALDRILHDSGISQKEDYVFESTGSYDPRLVKGPLDSCHMFDLSIKFRNEGE